MKKTKADLKVKLTKNETLVLRVLTKTSEPLGAYAILKELRRHGFRAPLTVYRALDQLAAKGLVHKLESLNSWTTCCGEDHRNPSIFEICNDCGNVAEHFDKELIKIFPYFCRPFIVFQVIVLLEIFLASYSLNLLLIKSISQKSMFLLALLIVLMVL